MPTRRRRTATALTLTLAVTAALLVRPAPSRAFSGEDPMDGPWHHEHLSRNALSAEGFSSAAADRIAWYADYIDSYLYNPLWWIQSFGLSRAKVSWATYGELAKLHFDDSVYTGDIESAYMRYTGGAMAGLLWAAEQNDVESARLIVGVSLHAIQDFYSHSNWVDASGRRAETWFKYPRHLRSSADLYSGTYETPDEHGRGAHGKLSLSCSLFADLGAEPIMDLVCMAISPMSNASVCVQYRRCGTAQETGPSTVVGMSVPADMVYLLPAGIAIDNKWLAGVALQVRGLQTQMSSLQLFNSAYGLAGNASREWLQILETNMIAQGRGAFWQSVKTGAVTGAKEDQYERYDRFAYQFMSAGDYPSDDQGTRWYLRVELTTATDGSAGTDGTIKLKALGRTYPLDYEASGNPLLDYNDFEQGDVAVYTVGPFDSLPASIELYNDTAGLGDIATAIWNDFKAKVGWVLDTIGDFLLSLIAGHADEVGINHTIFTPTELAALPSGVHARTINVDGGGEGNYNVTVTVQRTASFSGATPLENADEWQVTVTQLKCIEESDWDRGSNSDEPFLLMTLAPTPGTLQKARTEPFSDVDSGETRTVNKVFTKVKVPRQIGGMTFAVAIFESDDESSAARDQLLDELAGELVEDDAYEGVTDAIGRTVSPDWKLQRIKVHAFTRGRELRLGKVLDATVNTWIAGDSGHSFALDATKVTMRMSSTLPLRLYGQGLPEFALFGASSSKWSDYFCVGSEECRVGDVNGDGKEDLIAFTRGGTGDVWVALSDGSKFGPPYKWHDSFCYGSEECRVGDVNGDGKTDLVAFTRDYNMSAGRGDVWVALSTGWSFGGGQRWHDFFCIGQEQCEVADVNGDGRADVVLFIKSSAGGTAAGDVLVSLNTGSAFAPGAGKWHDWFCIGQEICGLGDVNGDGRTDLVTFLRGTGGNVYVSKSTGSAFAASSVWATGFCTGNQLCRIDDVDADGKSDLVAFVGHDQGGAAAGDVLVRRSTGNGFSSTQKWHDAWCVLIPTQVCTLGDTNGDGAADLIGLMRGAVSDSWLGDVHVTKATPPTYTTMPPGPVVPNPVLPLP